MASSKEEDFLTPEENLEKLKNVLKSDTAAAMAFYNDIVIFSADHNLTPDIAEEAVQLLAAEIKDSSPFQKLLLAKKASKSMCTSSKILLARQFSDQFSSGFSIDCLFSNKGMSRNWHKISPKCPMAYGLNTNGKLGVGSDDQMISKFQKIDLSDKIDHIVIGENHTIFCESTEKFYGAGASGNFMTKRSEEGNCLKPTEIDLNGVAEISHDYETWKIEATPTSTQFPEIKEKEKVLEVGGTSLHRFIEASDNSVQKSKKWEKLVTIADLEGNPTEIVIKYKLLTYYIKRNGERKQPISWFFCGNRVEKFTGEVKFGNNGTIWACYSNVLYTGNLKLTPGKDENTQDLVAFLEEVVTEYFVEQFAVSEDGKSVIIYPIAEEVYDPPNVSCLISNIYDHISFAEHDLETDVPFDEAYARFKEIIEEEWRGKMHETTGLPSTLGESVLPWTNTILWFLEMDEKLKIPKYLAQFPDQTLHEKPVKYYEGEICGFLCETSAIPPIVVEAGWTEEEVEQRKEQINAHEKEYFENLLSKIDHVLEILKNVPTKYRRKKAVEDFKISLASLMYNSENDKYAEKREELQEDEESSDSESEIGEPMEPYIRCKNVGEIIKERVKQKDINEEEERFKLIRVEAILYEYHNSHDPFVVFTTLSHIKMIDPSLCDGIRNGILNLNQYCIEKEKEDINKIDGIFRPLVDKFFGTTVDYQGEVNFMDNLRTIFPDSSDIYTIITNDRKTSEVPRILLELYSSGFDAARRRSALERGSDPNRLEMNISKDNLRLLMHSLIDVRELEKEPIDRLLEILKTCRFHLFTDIFTDLIRIIVKKAALIEDCETIQKLIFFHPKQTREYVAIYCPQSLIHWSDFPLGESYLENLKLINKEIRENCPTDRCTDTISAPRIQNVMASVEIDKNWLKEQLLNEHDDESIVREFEFVAAKWEPTFLHRKYSKFGGGGKRRGRKRKHQ